MWYVLSVVPKQGIVTDKIFSRGIFNMSKALAVTRRANVESRPPEIPTTAWAAPVWARRFLRPMA